MLNQNQILKQIVVSGRNFSTIIIVKTSENKWVCQTIYQLSKSTIVTELLKLKPQVQGMQKTRLVKLLEFNNQYAGQWVLAASGYIEKNNTLIVYNQPYENTLESVDKSQWTYITKLRVVEQVAKALHFLKQKQVCHRSLQPINIAIVSMTSSKVKVKLNLLTECVKNNLCQQMPPKYLSPYSAPELLRNKNHSYAADLWSLGLIFYELVFGNKKKAVVLTDKVQIEFPENTENWLKNIFKMLLAFDEKDRNDVQTFLRLLKALILCANTAGKYIARFDP